MFKNQNAFANTQNIQHQDLSQDKDMKIDDIQIFTMAKDLEEIEHPEMKKARLAENSIHASTNLTAKQQSSPFLSETPAPKQKIEPQPKTQKPSFFASLFRSNSKESAAKTQQYVSDQIAMRDQKNPPAPKTVPQQTSIAKRLEEQQLAEQRIATERKLVEQKENEKRIAEMKAAAEAERAAAEKLAAQKIATQRTVEIKKTVPEPNENSSQKNPTKLVAILTVAFIILTIGTGAYYFVSTRQTTPKPIPAPEPEPEIALPVTEPEIITAPKLSFSSDKPNYLVIDTTATNNTEIKESIAKYTEDIKKSSITIPIEFLVTDAQNNPVDFATFSQKIGFTLSKNVLANLDKKFSLFIVNDNNNMRLGLAINFIDSDKLKAALSKEEITLAKSLSSILLSTNYELPKSTFGKSEYNGLAIRYQNIVSPESLSIDYTLTDKQLLIGTTKMTLRSIVDKILPIASKNIPESVQPVDNLSSKD